MIEYTVRDFGHVHKWYKKDTHILHREGGPAVVANNGHKEWWLDNMLHNPTVNYKGERNPTIIYSDESVAYYYYGVLHREDGPAFKQASGYDYNNKKGYIFYHYQYGDLHNLNGPAVYSSYGGDAAYYVDGIKVEYKNFSREVEIYKNITLKTASIREYIQQSVQKNPGQFPDLYKVIGDYKCIIPDLKQEDLFLILTRVAEKNRVSFKKQSFDTAWGKMK